MPLTFPASPTIGQQSTQNGRTYSWSGSVWELAGNVSGHKDRHAVGGADALAPADIGAVPSAGGTLTGNLTHAATQTFVSSLGSQGSPSHTFTGDTNTGIYSPGADRIAIVTGGAIRLGINAEGRVGVGALGTIARSLFVASPITGHTEAFGVLQQGVVQTDVTSVVGVYNIVHTAVDVASSYIHFSAAQGALGAGTVLSSQIGYFASGSMTAATVNYGFRADIAAGTGRWNVASLGTAQNVFRGNVGIGASRETPSSALDVNGVITVAVGSVSAPAITFSGDTNTGFFSPSTDIIAVATAGVERLRVDASGNIGVGFINPTTQLDLSGSTLRLRTARTPSATGAVGEVCWDADYVWICTATNTWRRITHSTSGDDARWEFFKPAAPTGVTATAGNAQAVVSWTASAIVVPPLTDYIVQYSSDSGSNWTTFFDGTSTATSATVTGLTNGTAYVFRVAGINGIGTGAYSTASAAVTPVAGDALFSSVSLLLPMDGTGSTFVDSSLTPKTITASGNATQSTAQSKFGGKSLALDGGSAIRIPSNAAFGFGTGDFTVEFFLYYTGGNGYVFFANMNDGSGPYLSYGLNNGTKRPWLWNDGDALNTSTNVTNNVWQHHAFVRSGGVLTIYLDGVATGSTAFATDLGSSRVFDIGDNGGGAQATSGYIDSVRITKGHARYTANFTPPTAAFQTVGPMSAPTSLSATGGNAQVSLTWTAPAYNGGSAITDYSVQFSSNSGSTWSTFSRAASTTASQVVTGLTNGTAYVFRVAGINVDGTGTYTAASSSVTPSAPSAPTAVQNLAAPAGACGANASWAAPASAGSSAITGYRVVLSGTYIQNAGTTTQAASVRTKYIAASGEESFSITVFAVNAVGESPGVTVSGHTGYCS